MKPFFENWRKYLNEIVETFPPITEEELIDPFKHARSIESKKKWTILEIYKAFEQIKKAVLEKNEQKARGGLIVIKTMTGGELNFDNAEQAIRFYIQNNLKDIYIQYEKILDKDYKMGILKTS